MTNQVQVGSGSLLAAAAAAVALALAAAVPGCESPVGGGTLMVVGAAGILLPILAVPAARDVSLAPFVTGGVPCMLLTLTLAAPPYAALLIAVGRGAPLTTASAGALTGTAGLLLAAAAIRLTCPMEERLHLLVWHFLPVAAGSALTALIGVMWLSRWRLARDRR